MPAIASRSLPTRCEGREQVRRGDRSTGVPDEFFASFRLPRVPVDSCRGNVLFEPVQLGFEVFDLLLEIFELLRASVSAVRDGHQLDHTS